ncbi:MAG TPA: hypothetical protein VIY08_04455 [Candidatus Nitrosocosmicus sp.]
MRDLKKYNDRIDVSERIIIEGIKFVLSHFENQDSLFPRTISTNSNPQIKITYEASIQNTLNNIFEVFKKSNYYDCKINGFNYYDQDTENNESKSKKINIFIMINLNLQDISFNKKKLDFILENTLNKMYLKLDEVHPTVLWNGLGYEIYQPLEGSSFENHKYNEFKAYVKDGNISNEFLIFAKKFFTDTKIESNRVITTTSYNVSVPGTFNFENGEQVEIIHKWDGKKPSILWINNDFKNHLISMKSKYKK